VADHVFSNTGHKDGKGNLGKEWTREGKERAEKHTIFSNYLRMIMYCFGVDFCGDNTRMDTAGRPCV